MHMKYVQIGAILIAVMLLSSAAALSSMSAYADSDGKGKSKEAKEKAKEAKEKAKQRVKEVKEKAKKEVEAAKQKVKEAKKKAQEEIEEAKQRVKEAQQQAQASVDDDDDDDDDNQNVMSAPAHFSINATGIAVVKKNKTASDLTINLNTTTTKVKHNQVEMDVSGTIMIGSKKYDVNGEGSIVFKGAPWGSALLKLKGKASDGSTSKPLKFKTRATLFPESANTWKMLAKNGKLGPFIHLQGVTGKVVSSGTVTPPPVPTGQNHFVINDIPSPQTAGVPFNVTVTAVNATGGTIKTYVGPMKLVNATGGIDMTISTGFVNGTWKGLVNATEAAKFRLTAHDVANPAMKGTSNEFTVVPAALARIDVTPANVTLNRGASAEFTARGYDRFGNEITGFAPAWSLSSSDFGSIAVTGNKATFTASSTAPAGSLVLTASSGSLSDTATINISLTPTQELHHFVVGNITSPQTAGAPFSVTVRAARADGTTVTTYANPIRLTDSLGTLNMTASSGFVSGIWTGNVQVTKTGTDRITVVEVANPSKTGASNDFTVVAGALDRFVVGPIANQTAGVELDVLVKAVDSFGNVKTNYAGNVTLSTNNGASPAGNVTVFTPAMYPFTPADLGQHTFKAKMYNAKTDTTVTASDGSKSGTSNTFRVSAASATRVTVSPTAVTLSVGDDVLFTAKAFDAFGNQLSTAAFTWTPSPLSLGTVTPSASTSTATFIASTTGSGTLTVSAGTGSVVANINVT